MQQSMILTRDGVYRSSRPMTDSDIQRAAPAALAVEAHDSRSDQYQAIPTMAVVEALRKSLGVEVYGATQARTRDVARKGHTKHVLRLRRPEDNGSGDMPELVLTNSYDGSTSYRLNLGVFRLVCANGLMVGKTWDSASVRHIGTEAVPLMVDETKRLARQFDTVRQTVEGFKQLALSPQEITAFGRATALLRHDPNVETIRPDDVVRAQRRDDRKDDLWTVLNRAQEGLTRGRYWKVKNDAEGRPQASRVRPVKGIDQNAALNQAVWSLAEEMQRLKAA